MMSKNFTFCSPIVVKDEIYYSDADETKNIGMNVVQTFNEHCTQKKPHIIQFDGTLPVYN